MHGIVVYGYKLVLIRFFSCYSSSPSCSCPPWDSISSSSLSSISSSSLSSISSSSLSSFWSEGSMWIKGRIDNYACCNEELCSQKFRIETLPLIGASQSMSKKLPHAPILWLCSSSSSVPRPHTACIEWSKLCNRLCIMSQTYTPRAASGFWMVICSLELMQPS